MASPMAEANCGLQPNNLQKNKKKRKGKNNPCKVSIQHAGFSGKAGNEMELYPKSAQHTSIGYSIADMH